MKKEELKTGDMLTLRNRNKCVISCATNLINISNGEYVDDLWGFNDDLTNKDQKCLDIIKVTRPSNLMYTRPTFKVGDRVELIKDVSGLFGIYVEKGTISEIRTTNEENNNCELANGFWVSNSTEWLKKVEDKKEMTIKEIEEKLGFEIKIVKGDK